MDWLTFWIAALATYRISILIARDRGPFAICAKAREHPRFKKFLSCPFCVSPYIGSLVALALFVDLYWAFWFLLPLALSGVTVALDRIFTSDYVQK